jgi:hypothetical protein
MKKQRDHELHQLLVLLKLDAQRLFERIKYRAPEYLNVLSLKRTREHFKDVFKSRYFEMALTDLKKCSEEVIIGLDQFYSKVDNLHWYLNHTQDMPMMISDRVYAAIKELEGLYQTLTLYIDAELGIGEQDPVDEVPLEMETLGELEALDSVEDFEEVQDS